MDPVGTGGGAQLFLHGMWLQYKVKGSHEIGAGLHYLNGISRLNNQSTLNMMTLDNNRASWATLGLSDQFARHLGVFGKGSIGPFQYQVSINQSLVSSLDGRDTDSTLNTRIYRGAEALSALKAAFNYAGYFKVDLLDKESNFLPYKVGTYLGSKKILSIGAGYFVHPNAVVHRTTFEGPLETETVSIMAVDIFYDSPLGEEGKAGAITAYAVYQYNGYGQDYILGAYGSGHMVYGHVGYLIPTDSKLVRFQPYVSYANSMFEVDLDSRHIPGVGVNSFFNGHHSKLTLEYQPTLQSGTTTHRVRLQAMVYL